MRIPAAGGVKLTVELELEKAIEQLAHRRPRGYPQGDEVTALDDGFGLAIADGERGGTFDQPGARREGIIFKPATSARVGFGYIYQSVDTFNLASQSANRTVTGVGGEQLIRAHVRADQVEDGRNQVRFPSEPIEKAPGGLNPGGLMVGRAPAAIRKDGVGGFSKVVTKHGEPDDEVLFAIILAKEGKGIHAGEGVVPDIALGVPF